MALEICEAAKRNCREESINGDRFSDLPDEIAHRVLSLLSFKDLTCVGCVSKRCKNLQLSIPFINFRVSRGDHVAYTMLDSFNSFMIQRGDNKVHRFRLLYFHSRDGTDSNDVKSSYERLRLSALINSAVRCNVDELCVNVSPPPADSLFSLPAAIFLCGSLRSLSVRMKCVIGEVSSFPSLSNLTSLNLARVSVIDESFWEWISCSCKRLETLSLRNIHGSKNIIISSSSLKTVSVFLLEGVCCNLTILGNRLERIIIDWDYASSNTSLHISAPYVKWFQWNGSFSCHQNLGEMRCLHLGQISCYSEVSQVTEIATLADLLCSMRWVKTLELNHLILKALSSKDGFKFASLNEVCFLKVTCSLTDDLVPGLTSLLQKTPSLSSLQLNSRPSALKARKGLSTSNSCGFDMEFWKLQNLAIIDHLKKIAISLTHGSNVFEFARYIVKHAQNLERADIFIFPNQFDDVMKLRDEMISNGTVTFHQYLHE